MEEEIKPIVINLICKNPNTQDDGSQWGNLQPIIDENCSGGSVSLQFPKDSEGNGQFIDGEEWTLTLTKKVKE